MILDDRKRRILQAIVEDFVSTGEPVGSRTVAKKYDMGMSAATIRNDMADLEEMGLLQQPHTSSGRVPSDLGYRTYVDKIMKIQVLSEDEISKMREKLEISINEINQLIKQVSTVLSQLTNYTAVAISSQLEKSAVKHIQLVPVDKSKILLVLVTNNGAIKNFIVNVKKEYGADFLFTVSNVFNDKYAGISLKSINTSLSKQIDEKDQTQKDVLIPIFETLNEKTASKETLEVFLGGTSNIFNFPEFSNINKAKEFLDVLNEKELMINLLGCINDKDVHITIGSENMYEEIKVCSLITTSYWIGDRLIGSVGVIGPTRMNYSKVISYVEYLRNEITNIIKEICDE